METLITSYPTGKEKITNVERTGTKQAQACPVLYYTILSTGHNLIGATVVIV